MKALPINYRHLYITELSYSGFPAKDDSNYYIHCISYMFAGQERVLWRRSHKDVPTGDLIIRYENYLSFYEAFDPEDGTNPEFLVQYDYIHVK